MQIEKENDTIFYKYDNQGNTLEEKSSKGTTTYTYDIYNRTKEVITETGDHIKNSYTPLGLRYKKEVNGQVYKYISDDWNIIAEVDKENNIKSREIRGYELLKKEVENKDYFYHTNEHGDVTYLSNIAGEIENSYSYDVFGNIKEQKEAISNQFKYTGEQYDSEVQQYYLRARFYNPTIGRFTQEDVYRDDGLNLYVYVINNPLLWADPSGYAKCSQNKKENNYDSNNKTDFIVTPNGIVMPTNKNYDLVDSKTPTNQGGDWIQIHNTHLHDGLKPHTHFPKRNIAENGRVRVDRKYKETDIKDIEYVDKVLRDGTMRERVNKKDKGGYLK